MTESPPPRLWLVSRPETEHTLVIRRGPSKQVAFLGWNRKTNAVQLGQWLKGVVYPRRCDLSPDGKYLLYFALSGKWQDESQGAWTAVSRYPYLKAIDFWPKVDTWGGGGLFLTSRSYVLNEMGPHQQHTLSGKFTVKREGMLSSKEIPSGPLIYFSRLQRFGWTYEGTEFVDEESSKKNRGCIYQFSRVLNSKLVLKKRIYDGAVPSEEEKGRYRETHHFEGAAGAVGYFENIQNLEYVKGLLFWPDQGKLYTAKVKGPHISATEMVHDFTGYTFEEVLAPY